MPKTKYRIKMAFKGVENPTRFFTGSPIVAVCPTIFSTEAEAREASFKWEELMLDGMPPGTETMGAEIFADTTIVSIGRSVGRVNK